MASCNTNNTLFIGRPSKDSRNNSVSCQTGSFNPAGRCPEGIGPRKNRENVIEDLKDWVLVYFGAPVVKVELDQQNLDAAVLQALKVFEDYAPAEYYDYYVFDTEPGKSVYTLPPDVGLVRSVHFKEMGNFAFAASDLDGALPVEYFYPGGAYSSIQGGLIDPIQPIWGRMGEWVLYKQYEQMYSRTASNLGGWEWVGGFNNIKIYPTPQGGRCSRVIVRYLQKCKDWHEVAEAMQEGATAYAKIMLGHIRRKYRNPPGPNGGVQLDGAELVQEGREDLKQWKEDLIYRFGDLLPIHMD